MRIKRAVEQAPSKYATVLTLLKTKNLSRDFRQYTIYLLTKHLFTICQHVHQSFNIKME